MLEQKKCAKVFSRVVLVCANWTFRLTNLQATKNRKAKFSSGIQCMPWCHILKSSRNTKVFSPLIQTFSPFVSVSLFALIRLFAVMWFYRNQNIYEQKKPHSDTYIQIIDIVSTKTVLCLVWAEQKKIITVYIQNVHTSLFEQLLPIFIFIRFSLASLFLKVMRLNFANFVFVLLFISVCLFAGFKGEWRRREIEKKIERKNNYA